MTKANDLTDLIAASAALPSEQKALEHLAGRLEDSLSGAVPYRPEFKKNLRKQLIAQARKQNAPWFRRPAVLGSSLGLVAAAAVLAVGVQMYRPGGPGAKSGAQSAPPQVPPVAESPGITSQQPRVGPRLVARVQVPVVPIPDEALPVDVMGPEPLGAVDPAAGLKLIQLTGRPDAQLIGDIALRLGLTERVRTTATGFEITQASQRLAMTSDGHIVYNDALAAGPTGTPTGGAEGARSVARRFLTQAALPVPDRLPLVTEGPVAGLQHAYAVTYTQRVEGRAVVNARVEVLVTESSGVIRADAFVPAGQEDAGTFEAVTAGDAVQQAQSRGGATFGGADMVWVRTVSGPAVYLQPYWRVFGADALGVRIARYVPALSR